MPPIYLTKLDYERLLQIVQTERLSTGNRVIEGLGQELKRARLVASDEIPPDVVTMNSVVRLRELKSGTELEITLVYPRDADAATRKISILAPVATAVLGCRVGDEIEWPVPKGTVSYRVEAVLYQPEAAGDLFV
ncbi:nucleoside diphosphate kinase regulator [Hymenobacter psychrotolerans]|uniref:Regulator of nucleoside diphosphate kinase n=1 Tax=Hymenobacter psychrotolerans DSM 18569 TaxID=1121959 RepID=A0A1M6P7Q9_9BACT|nr:nucleoside diphosphate kinase regulator [Hymenobacter psychrotolerans]SHK03930.1 regulator of nucleoside diphosphate kinase [Hymenobacter psychrotolerans DSM 18569]